MGTYFLVDIKYVDMFAQFFSTSTFVGNFIACNVVRQDRFADKRILASDLISKGFLI